MPFRKGDEMIERLSRYGIWTARVSIALVFLFNATGIIDQSKPAHEMVERGVPVAIVPFLMWCGRGLELLAGLALVFGFQQRLAALGLVAFLVPATFIAHPFWLASATDKQIQLINFMKNLAMIGGLLFIASTFTTEKNQGTHDSLAGMPKHT
jgi:putative oxidoreductase